MRVTVETLGRQSSLPNTSIVVNTTGFGLSTVALRMPFSSGQEYHLTVLSYNSAGIASFSRMLGEGRGVGERDGGGKEGRRWEGMGERGRGWREEEGREREGGRGREWGEEWQRW